MAQLTFTIPDAQMQNVVDAWGEDYENAKQEAETKPQFAKRQIANTIKIRVQAYQGRQIPEIDVEY